MKKIKTFFYFYPFFYFLLDYGVTFLAIKNNLRTEVNPLNNFLIERFGPNSLLVVGLFLILIFVVLTIKPGEKHLDLLKIFLNAFLIATVVNAIYLILTAIELVFHFSWLEYSPAQILIFLIPTVFFTAFYLFFGSRREKVFLICLFGQLFCAGVLAVVFTA